MVEMIQHILAPAYAECHGHIKKSLKRTKTMVRTFSLFLLSFPEIKRGEWRQLLTSGNVALRVSLPPPPPLTHPAACLVQSSIDNPRAIHSLQHLLKFLTDGL